MSPSDSQKLHDFLAQLIQARGIEKDPEANALIQRAVAQQPDAAYLLVQRALLMEQALDSARAQIASLESQLEQHQTSQGGSLDPHSRGKQTDPSHQQPHHMHYQHATPGSMSRATGGVSGGSMLGSIAATGAGVAAGSFLFHGLDSFLHDHDGQGGTALADYAGLNGIDAGNTQLGAEGGIETSGGFFDGDGSDEGVFD